MNSIDLDGGVMSDKELLELAAKAIGHAVARQSDDELGLMLIGGQEPWNPLADDGDALRLAVRCRIRFHEGSGDGPEAFAGRWVRGGLEFVSEPHNDNPDAATRRAIVRTAAEIGKEMP